MRFGISFNALKYAERTDRKGKQTIVRHTICISDGLLEEVAEYESKERCMEVMKEFHAEEIPGVIHCYSYSREMAQEFIKMGYYIGVGGVVTFKNAKKLKETVEAIPLERILLETDCPYMAPERGTRNDSSNIPFVIAKIAELKGITAEEVERVTEENAGRLFTKVS